MPVEKEIKYKIDCKDLETIKKKLEQAGAIHLKTQHETDHYLQHPCRDLRKADEALRVRITNGKIETLTYKGPRTGKTIKEREEINVEVHDENILNLLYKLGFKIAITVKKQREYYRYKETLITLDQVEQLGCYIELELYPEATSTETLFKTVETLEIKGQPTTQSYAELLSNINKVI